MWLLVGQKAPDHSTIARFRTGFLADACENLFYQMVKRLENAGGLSKETVFIDGTKLEACANKYTFVWKRSVGKWETKMFQKIQEAVSLLNREYIQSFQVTEATRTQDLQEICRFLERQTIYDWHTASFQGRNNYCKTDPDATFMRMKDDHMRNAKLKPGYNVQIAVDSEYIVATDIFQDRNDVWTLVPFLKRMEEKLGFRYPSVTADSGYESEEGYSYLREQKQKPYIKPQTYEKWKKRSFKKDISKRENMGYDERTDTYTCHAGNKRLYVSKSFLEKRQESYENILSEKGIQYRMNRSIQVEGAFGVLKNDYGFQRFLLRGKTKVKLEILLLSMGYDLNKLHAKIQNDRTGKHLFPVKKPA